MISPSSPENPPSQEKCPFCQGSLRFFRTLDNQLYHECSHCQWITLDRAHHLPPDGQKKRYLQHENSRESGGYVEMLNGFIDEGVAPLVRPGAKVLDFGCGPEPLLAELLTARGYRVDVYDLFFHSDMSYLHQKYHLITMTEVLEHLPDPLEVLSGLALRLEEGGAIALMTLFHPNQREGFQSWWYRRDSTHVAFYTPKTLERMGESLNLRLVFSDGQRTAVLKKI